MAEKAEFKKVWVRGGDWKAEAVGPKKRKSAKRARRILRQLLKREAEKEIRDAD